MAEYITDIAALEAIYGHPGEASLVKVARKMTPEYAAWIAPARFCILSTVGPEGTDASPRGDRDPVVRIVDDQTLLMPDWRGNNRMDSLRNIVADGRVSLMFMIPGQTNVIRVNGRAKLRVDGAICEGFEIAGKHPRSVIEITIQEIYSQCARALMRAEIWGDAPQLDLPSMGQILAAQTASAATPFDGDSYDREWSGRAAETMW